MSKAWWTAAGLALLAGCATAPPSVSPVPAESPGGSGEMSAEPRALAVGEWLQDHRRAVYDRQAGTYDLYVGGVLWAKWHPWRRELRILPLAPGERGEGADWSAACRWGPAGRLTGPEAGTEHCRALLDDVARRLARSP